MPLTPEQQALRDAAAEYLRNPTPAAYSAYASKVTPGMVGSLLAQLDGCNEDYDQAADSVAQLQDEVFAVRAQLEAVLAAPAPLQFCFDGGPPMAVYTPPRLEQDWDASVPAQTGSEVTAAAIPAFNRPYEALNHIARKVGAELRAAMKDDMPEPVASPPGSAGSGNAINTSESLSAAEGSMEDFADAADLVDAMTAAEAKGDALGLVLAYRHKVRSAALSQPVQAVPDGWRPMPIEPDKKMLQALANNCFSPKSGYADLLAAAPVFAPGDSPQ